jgi:hypothetical protein
MSRPRLIGLLLALITLLVYLPVCRYNFQVYDDDDYVTNNHIVQNGLTWAGVKWAFTTGHASNWHPLTWLSHMLDYELFGLNAGAQHYVNVLFHRVNAVLLLLLLFRLTDALWPSAFVAALRCEPDNFQTLASTAYYLAANENADACDGKAALVLAIKANALSGNSQPLVFDALGMAFAETGDFTNAQTCAQNVLDLATTAQMKNTEQLRQRLELYKNHQPWRESFRSTNAPAKN